MWPSLRQQVEEVAGQAEEIFKNQGWVWYKEHQPTAEEIEERFWDMISRVRMRLEEGREHTMISSGRLSVHAHRWEDGSEEIFLNIEMGWFGN